LAAETHGHINSAGCEGMATTITAAHHSIWRHLYDSMHAAQKLKSKLKFVTLDKESNMSTQYNLDPEYFFVYCFWGRRLDGVAINEALQVMHILEFKRQQTGTRDS